MLTAIELLAVISGAIFGVLLARRKQMDSVVGTEYALQVDVAPFVAVLFGVITGTFGGVMGDIVCNEVPSLFRPSTPLYATCAFVGCWILIGAQALSLPDDTSFWVSATLIAALRLIALRFKIRLKAIGSG